LNEIKLSLIFSAISALFDILLCIDDNFYLEKLNREFNFSSRKIEPQPHPKKETKGFDAVSENFSKIIEKD